jgi:hypothetical protein
MSDPKKTFSSFDELLNAATAGTTIPPTNNRPMGPPESHAGKPEYEPIPEAPGLWESFLNRNTPKSPAPFHTSQADPVGGNRPALDALPIARDSLDDAAGGFEQGASLGSADELKGIGKAMAPGGGSVSDEIDDERLQDWGASERSPVAHAIGKGLGWMTGGAPAFAGKSALAAAGIGAAMGGAQGAMSADAPKFASGATAEAGVKGAAGGALLQGGASKLSGLLRRGGAAASESAASHTLRGRGVDAEGVAAEGGKVGELASWIRSKGVKDASGLASVRDEAQAAQLGSVRPPAMPAEGAAFAPDAEAVERALAMDPATAARKLSQPPVKSASLPPPRPSYGDPEPHISAQPVAAPAPPPQPWGALDNTAVKPPALPGPLPIRNFASGRMGKGDPLAPKPDAMELPNRDLLPLPTSSAPRTQPPAPPQMLPPSPVQSMPRQPDQGLAELGASMPPRPTPPPLPTPGPVRPAPLAEPPPVPSDALTPPQSPAWQQASGDVGNADIIARHMGGPPSSAARGAAAGVGAAAGARVGRAIAGPVGGAVLGAAGGVAGAVTAGPVGRAYHNTLAPLQRGVAAGANAAGNARVGLATPGAVDAATSGGYGNQLPEAVRSTLESNPQALAAYPGLAEAAGDPGRLNAEINKLTMTNRAFRENAVKMLRSITAGR